MLTLEQFKIMLTLQDKLNSIVNPKWLTAGYAWRRAIMVESVELLEHIGWKWWKKQEPNIPQAKIELVDIWHFMLSDLLVTFPAHAQAAEVLHYGLTQEGAAPDALAGQDTRAKIDLLAGSAGLDGINTMAFASIMVDVGLTWDELYRIYIAKNVLNIFRQNHGYKAGTYVKVWNGLEDNEHMTALMLGNPAATPDDLYQSLKATYAKVAA